HAGQIPAEVLPILHPLEVAGGHSASIGENVGQHEHFTLLEDGVGVDDGRVVGRLDDVLGPHVFRVVFREDAAQGSGNQNIHRQHQQFFVADLFALGKFADAGVVADEIEQSRNIETLGIEDAAVFVADGDDFQSLGVQKLCAVRADVSEPLNGNAG